MRWFLLYGVVMKTKSKDTQTQYELVRELIEKNMHITSAESCTGGMIAASIVDVPDASRVLSSALVTYSEEAKTKLLSVRPEYIRQFGVVSEQVAALMALGAARNAGAEAAISTTGVAGPSGGSKEIPVGTVCFGFFLDEKVTTVTARFEGDRNTVREAATEFALRKMLELVKNRA